MKPNYSQDRIWHLLSKKLCGEASAEELQTLETCLLENPELQHQVELLSQMWQQGQKTGTIESEAAYMQHLMNHKDEFFAEHHTRQGTAHAGESKPGRSLFIKLLNKKPAIGIVAGFIIIVVSWLFFFREKKPDVNTGTGAEAISSVVTKNGSRSKIVLPDGSQVWLNADSKLDYNNLLFNKELREVTLSGQAFFDVVKNPDKPFLVHTANLHIKVLGTTFDVKSYPDDKESETSLIHGSVEVTVTGRQEKFILRPSDKLVVNNPHRYPGMEKAPVEKPAINEPETIISFKKVNYLPEKNTILETAWVENRLEFSSEKFVDVAKKIERWFDVTIHFSDKKMEDILLTGTLPGNAIIEALEALKIAEPFTYTIEGNNIIIKP